ncbi:hypothetical protein SPRG_02697 [Saprolegnia parasitica CBS 223.65]|uniref:Mediator of RNA polymerase II transcription subunit 1 n=1 Tax=Saprolegnia parasitica (strain CBS 223.65) TaxID=695850 RepID=A0A067CNH5_SAPPC|nr:hypothetical protein SPRG_02697 [Saprolegnia parasitica CBS 223.65]KDO32219.1 hypothetical protein SPRG_02697 [Saprolegnia parasitica CBS 223.65]|eukprot:XP_012196677.1 hypothetical protein SPRG_02697 [Saprolegnia parasitica CBS 223.65]
MEDKTKPSLRSVINNLQSCLDEMLPDQLRNESATIFQQHLATQRDKGPSERTTWKGGLYYRYILEALKVHREWYNRNQQYVQLKKDEKRLEAHVATLRSIMASSLSTLELEVGLREAELEGRVGTYKVMFEVSKIASALSRPLVKLQVLKPNDSSISIYCDTFVLDIILSGGDGEIESTTLVTVIKEQSSQFPERDEDLLRSLQALVAGDSQPFTTKLYRLVNRAELAVKFPQTNFDKLENEMFAMLQQVCARSPKWSIARGVDGVLITFKDELQCFPLFDEPPQKRAKRAHDEDVDASADRGGWREWTGCVTFTEWKSSVVMHVLCDTPLIMSGIQSRRLAATILGYQDELREKAFMELANKAPSATKTKEDKSAFPISLESHLRFVREGSTNIVLSATQNMGLVLDCALVTKEIAGGVHFHAFPIPMLQASTDSLVRIFGVVGHSLFFQSILASCFLGRRNVFGRNEVLEMDNGAMTKVAMQVEVAAPTSMTLKLTSDVLEGESFHIEVETKEDYSMHVRLRNHPALNAAAAQIASACHSLPLLCYFLLQSSMKSAMMLADTLPEKLATDVDALENDAGDVVDDDDMAVGNDILLDDENFY